ncbi:MAG: hypothetical protein OEW87_01535 [Flavobacteriaceae bacterium]|nr:hypothetical protein [Flavobacteriaceae bacterium]
MRKSKLEHRKLKEKGFKAPDGYFDKVEDEIFARLTTEKFPKKIGFSVPSSYFKNVENSVLKKLGKENIQTETGQKIPEAYFESIEDRVFAKLKNEKPEVKVISFRSVLLKRIIPFAAAASLLLFFILNSNRDTISLDNVASTEIELWIENDLITLDTYEIADVYSDIELDNQDYFGDEEIIDYLDDMNLESIILEN